jgi:hypothetical protein
MFVHTFFAYVNPGSGLLVVQLLVAGVCGFIFSLKRFQAWLKGLFRRRDKQASDGPAENAVKDSTGE